MPSRSPAAELIPHLRRAVFASDVAGLTDGQLLGEFLRTHDEAAFAALVRRHGPMVLGVCRRVVGDAHAAEDAFQAVFLVLARRAAAVRPRQQVGNFLYGVAYRTALKARAVRARRRVVETQVHPMPHPEAKPADLWPDLQPVIDAELARLPDRLRLPVVLCDLEGRPQREVARQLGLPPATLANRLAAARRTLAKRLTDRGIALSGGALAAAVSANAAAAAVPPALTAAAVRTLSGAASAPVLQLTEGVLRMMMLAKLKAVVVASLAAAALVGGFGVGTLPAHADDKPAAKSDPTKPGLGPNLTDEEFLKRVCLDLRGDAPTRIEMHYFLDDRDAAKRKKVVGWLTEGEKAAVNGVWLNSNLGVDDITTLSADKLSFHIEGNTVNALPQGAIFRYPVSNGRQAWVLGADGSVLRVSDPLAANITWQQWLTAQQAAPYSYFYSVNRADTDAAFLQRVCQESRGTPPTRIEQEYFAVDQDPKKREKLVDFVLKDPAVAKKVGEGWKETVLKNVPIAASREYRVMPYLAGNWVTFSTAPDRFDSLIGQLLDGKRPDDQVLDALTAAVLGRLPTESEKAFALGSVTKAQDRKQAWKEVANTLMQTQEARQHADDLKARTK